MIRLSTSAILLVTCVTVILKNGGYAHQLTLPNITCDALNEIGTAGSGYNDAVLSICSALTGPSEDCGGFHCTFSYQDFMRLDAQIEPCSGDDGMTPGMSIEVNVGQITNVNLDMVFLKNSTVPLMGVDGTSMEVTVQQMDSGIIFGLRLVQNSSTFIDLIYPQAIPIDSSRFTCPGLPLPNKQTPACAAMRAISEAAPSDPFGTCVTDERFCTDIRCTNDAGAFQLSVISIFPCATPPAVRAFSADTELQAQIDVTVTSTTNNVPFRDQDIGSLDIRMEVNSDMTSIGYGIIGNINGYPDPRVYVPFTQIPIDRTLCPNLFPTSEPSNGPIYGIRLTGSQSSNMGRLEVVVNGQWGTICDQDATFFKSEADVACKQLGFGQAQSYGYYSSRVNSDANLDFSLPIVMNDVQCQNTPSATNIQSCDFQSDTSGCSHTEDIGVTCSNCSLYLCDDGECVNGAACDGTTECKDGSDENNIACAIVSGLSSIIKIVIAVGVTVLVLIIVVPIGICICVCMCTGACICCATKREQSSRRHPDVVVTSYAPGPEKLGPVV